MKQHGFVLTFAIVALLALAGCGGKSPAALNAQGNEAYAQQAYPGALDAYSRAGTENPLLAEPQYNVASVHYRQSDYEAGGPRCSMGRSSTAAQSWAPAGNYNRGNACFSVQRTTPGRSKPISRRCA